jgi:putative PIN family toxin of toxin-antitoxin system
MKAIGHQTEKMEKNKVVLDTNALLVSIPRKSPFRLVFDSFLSGRFDLLVSTEILNEYVEKIQEKSNSIVANNISEVMVGARNVIFVNVYFNWNLIKNDVDDNKFIDCAVAGDATFIVSNDKHFNLLKTIEFPRIKVIKLEEFLEILEKEK